jgi:hypothetical protein
MGNEQCDNDTCTTTKRIRNANERHDSSVIIWDRDAVTCHHSTKKLSSVAMIVIIMLLMMSMYVHV